MTGVHARTWMGVPATKKPVGIKGLSLIWTKDDGLVSEAHVYVDAAVVKAQLGAGPKQLTGLPVPTPPTFAAQVFEQSDPPDDSMALVVRGALDALENNNEAAYVGAMAADVDVYTLELAQPIHGKAGVKEYYKTTHKAIGQLDA